MCGGAGWEQREMVGGGGQAVDTEENLAGKGISPQIVPYYDISAESFFGVSFSLYSCYESTHSPGGKVGPLIDVRKWGK